MMTISYKNRDTNMNQSIESSKENIVHPEQWVEKIEHKNEKKNQTN